MFPIASLDQFNLSGCGPETQKLNEKLGQKITKFLTEVVFDRRQLFWEERSVFQEDCIAKEVCLPSLDEIERAIERPDCSENISAILGGKATPIHRETGKSALDVALGYYRKGNTILVAGGESLLDRVAGACRAIDCALFKQGVSIREATSANFYIGPCNADGLPIHYDNHCVIVVQIAGTKDWTVFETPTELPSDRCGEPIENGDLGLPILQPSLTPGDILYIPRGTPHCAKSGAQGSVHVTFSISCFTWADICGNANSSSSLMSRSANFTQISTDSCASALSYALAKRLEKFQPFSNGRIDALLKSENLSEDEKVCWAEHVILVSYFENDAACLSFPGGKLGIPAELSLVWKFVSENTVFFIRDLPDCSVEYDKIKISSILMRRGLIRRVGDFS